MLGRTHSLGGIAFGLGGFLCLKQTNGLIPDISETLQLGIIMPYAIWASTVPDLDQEKDSVALASPINLIIQKIFKLVGAGHRSAKSHVIPAVICVALYVLCTFGVIFKTLNGAEVTIAVLILLGLALGLASHAVLDCMTRDGLRVNGITIRLVPDLPMFGTGTVYELIVRKILYVLDCILIILILI